MCRASAKTRSTGFRLSTTVGISGRSSSPGLTPIPYKVFTLSAGVFAINFGVFLGASVLSRGLRFFLLAALIFKFGKPIETFIDRYFNLLVTVFGILLIGGFLLIEFVL